MAKVEDINQKITRYHNKIMFIATANYLEDIPEALRDRLEIVNLSGYTEYEKLDIVKTCLLPRICREHGINYKGIEIKIIDMNSGQLVDKIMINGQFEPEGMDVTVENGVPYIWFGIGKYQVISKILKFVAPY